MGFGNFFSEFSGLSSSLQILVISFALLGILFGSIFVLDGWYDSPNKRDASEHPNPLRASPKFLGLGYVLRAGVLPVLTDLVRLLGYRSDGQPGLAIAIYSLFVAITALFCIILLSLYSFVVAYSKIQVIAPEQKFLQKAAQALPFVSIALQQGNESFLERLNYISMLEDLAYEYKLQRDKSIDFLTGVFDRLVKNNIRHVSGVEAFIEFVRRYLEVFIQEFFEYDSSLGHYRASLYFLTSNSAPQPNNLIFICGHSHWSCRHSGRPLSIDESFAGYAIRNPGKIHVYINNGDESGEIPFEARQNEVRYNTIIASAIQPLRPPGNDLDHSRMVLCIDSDNYEFNLFKVDEEFLTKMTLFFAVMIATAQASMSVQDQDLEAFLLNSGPLRY